MQIHNLQNLLFCCLIVGVLIGCKNEPQPLQKAIEKDKIALKIDSLGNKYIAAAKVLGFSIALLQDGDTLYNKAFGYIDSARTKRATTKTIYNIASITKPHLTTVVLKLAEEGKLSLSDYLYEWLPDYPNEADAKKISLRNLISHTSGIPDYIAELDSLFLATGIAPNQKSYYDFVKNKPLLFEPDSGWSYSNTGFVLMGLIIEKATGNSLESEIERVIAKPMHYSSLRHFSENINNPNYTKSFELRDSVIGLSPMNSFTWIRADGGWSTTAMELAHLPKGLADGTLLNMASLEQMTKPQILDNGIIVDYGLGMRMGEFEEERVWGHTGGDASTWGMLQYFPGRDLSIAVLVNTNSTPHDAMEIWGPVALAAVDKKMPVLSKREPLGEMADKIIGDYQSTVRNTSRLISITASRDGKHLLIKTKNSDSQGEQLFNLENNSFTIEQYPMDRLIFHTNQKGKVLGYSLYANGSFRGLRTKIK